MTRSLNPDQFADAVADYAHGDVDREYVARAYNTQRKMVYSDHLEPLDPARFIASLRVSAGVRVSEPDRDRLIQIYEDQLDELEGNLGGTQ